MANRVLTIFEGKADQLFVTANRVEKRLEDFAKNTAQLPVSAASQAQAAAPVLTQQRQLTEGIRTEVQKRTQIEQTAARSGFARYEQNTRNITAIAKQESILEQTRNAIRTKREGQEAAADARRIAARQVADRAEQRAAILRNAALINVRRAAFAERAAMERAETVVVQTEAVKQAAARRSALLGQGSLATGALRGAGIGGIAGLSPAGIAGFATIGISALAIRTYSKEISEAEGRTKRFSVISRETGIAQQELAASVEKASRQFRISRKEAEDIIGPIANLAGESRRSFVDLKDAAIDLASARGIDRAQLPNLLNEIAQGTANTALLGKNAASIFDLYANSLGKTADKLTDTEKKQALVNRLLSDGALAAGDAANSIDRQTASFDALGKSATSALAALGAIVNVPLKSYLDQLAIALGGEAQFGRFDPSRAFQQSNIASRSRIGSFGVIGLAASALTPASLGGKTPEQIYQDDLEAGFQEIKKKHDETIRRFNEDRARYEQALANPNASLVNRALSRISRETFAGLNTEDRQKLFDTVIADTKEFANLQVKVYQDELKRISQSGGGADALRGLFRLIEGNRQIIGEDAFRGLSDSISTQIERGAKEGFQRQIDAAKDNVPRLRKLLGDAYRVPDLPAADRERFASGLRESIEKAIDAGKDKVRQLGDAIRGVFDTIGSRAAAGNPFLEFLNSADKRMQDLRRNTAGFSNTLRGALAQIEQTSNRRDVIGLRLDASLQALDLRGQAREFRQGFRNDLSDPAVLQRLVDLQLRTLGQAQSLSPFFDINDPRLSKEAFTGAFRFLSGQGIQTGDPLQRAISDQKLIGLVGSLDPAKLREDQRKAIAEALEREAERRLSAEREAQESRAKQVELQKSIDAELKKLNALANSGGLDAIVRVLNDSDRARTEQRGTAADTARRFR